MSGMRISKVLQHLARATLCTLPPVVVLSLTLHHSAYFHPLAFHVMSLLAAADRWGRLHHPAARTDITGTFLSHPCHLLVS